MAKSKPDETRLGVSMKKTILCSIPMRDTINHVVYESDDRSLPSSENPFYYPVNAFLSQTMNKGDELSVILLVKQDKFSRCGQNKELFCSEMDALCDSIGATASYKLIDTEFSQSRAVHEELMKAIVLSLEDESKIIADITYGSKDVPIVMFTALGFAEKHLHCVVENILYGKANFVDGTAVNTKLCDMMPLYCLNSVTQTIKCDDPQKARQLLVTLLNY